MNVRETIDLFTVSVVYRISDCDFHVFDKGNDNYYNDYSVQFYMFIIQILLNVLVLIREMCFFIAYTVIILSCTSNAVFRFKFRHSYLIFNPQLISNHLVN